MDSYGQQWAPRVVENSVFPMSPLPVLNFTKQQLVDNTIAPGGSFILSSSEEDIFAATYGSDSNWNGKWDTPSTPTAIYKLIKIELEVDKNVYEDRYYIIFVKNGVNGQEQIGRIKNNKFSFNGVEYTISPDRTTIISANTKGKESIIDSFDLLKMFKGKDALISSVDEYALPSSNKNLWGSYWLNSDDREKYDIRVGVFDPAETSYEYKDTDGNKTAERLNPAGNYCIGKLENFHPLRLPDDKDRNPVELYIRNATIKGFKTAMDWPNASAVAPRDCTLRSGTIWIQYIFAYPVKEEQPRLFYRVLFDGWVNPNEHPGLSSGIRYPWSPCYEIITADKLEDLKADMQTMFETQISDLNEQIATLQTNITKSAAKDSLMTAYALLSETDGSSQYLTNHSGASDLTLSKILAGNRLMLYIAHTDDAMAPNFYCITDRFSLDANKITELDTAGTILKIPAYRVYTTDSNSTRTSGTNNVVFNGGISKVDNATGSEEYTVITANNVDNYIAKCTSDTSVTLIIQVVGQGYYKFFVKTSDETQNLLNGISSENNKLYILA